MDISKILYKNKSQKKKIRRTWVKEAKGRLRDSVSVIAWQV